MSVLRIMLRRVANVLTVQFSTSTPSYSAGAGKVADKLVPPTLQQDENAMGFVEADPHKIMDYACINYMKEGEHVKLKADDEYPEWLWTLRVDPQVHSDYMDPDIDGWAYWEQRIKEHDLQKKENEAAAKNNWFVQHNNTGQLAHKKTITQRKRKGNQRRDEPWK